MTNPTIRARRALAHRPDHARPALRERSAQAQAVKAGPWRPLFDGRTLDGWTARSPSIRPGPPASTSAATLAEAGGRDHVGIGADRRDQAEGCRRYRWWSSRKGLFPRHGRRRGCRHRADELAIGDGVVEHRAPSGVIEAEQRIGYVAVRADALAPEIAVHIVGDDEGAQLAARTAPDRPSAKACPRSTSIRATRG